MLDSVTLYDGNVTKHCSLADSRTFKADRLAKEGAKTRFSGSGPVCGIGWSRRDMLYIFMKNVDLTVAFSYFIVVFF